MNPLQKHVDRLFAKYTLTPQIREMKDEILGNLEAKVADLTTSGMKYDEAVRQATASLTSVDGLIDDHRNIYISRYRLELVQTALLYSLILWIFTIPTRLIDQSLLSYQLLAVVLVIAIIYLVLKSIWKKEAWNYTKQRNLKNAKQISRWGWLVWGLFILIFLLALAALDFGSNIWFNRQIKIDGPYQFAQIGIKFAKPFLTIFIPLMLQASVRLMQKHEAVTEEFGQ
ncbi:permease prefix domain 1-containing protein [Paenibacillus puldeungensis]|uniref:Permease prefix domain 1-containing protein n=2 Tax=Paenibacillus puldeungensis TaxID=696536 RepID=A0ABW3RT15_9BACL